MLFLPYRRMGTPPHPPRGIAHGFALATKKARRCLSSPTSCRFCLLSCWESSCSRAALNNYLVLTDATAVGARVLSISRGQTTDPCAATATAVGAAAPNLKTANLKFSFVLNGTAYSGATCSGAQTNLVEAQTAQVTVTYPCNLKFLGFNPAPSCTLTAQTTERVQ